MSNSINDTNFDPLSTNKRNSTTPQSADIYAQVNKDKRNAADLLRPTEADKLKTSANQNRNQFDNSTKTSATILSSEGRSADSQLHERIPQSSPPRGDLKNGAEHTENNHEQWDEQYPEDYYGAYNSVGPPPPYIEEPKKKGISAKLDRVIQRLPLLSIFYKPLPPTTYSCKKDQYDYSSDAPSDAYVPREDGDDEAPQLVDAEQPRDLTKDEVMLIERYSNKSGIKVIELQAKPETQPVDVCVQKELNYIHVCDVGRSVVEIFDSNGTLNHVIDDAHMTAFCPTSVSVGQDGTIIVGSHFMHRLQMYAPCQPEASETDDPAKDQGFFYQQFKLGQQGHDPHQFYYPAGIRCDDTDSLLYVCDRGNSRIQIIAPGGYCERIIQLMSTDGQPLVPIQLAFRKHKKSQTAVCIVGNGDCICFVPKYSEGVVTVEPLYVVDEEGLGLKGASSLCLDQNNYIFISDTGNNRIVMCSPFGSYISHFGINGAEIGQLNHPCGISSMENGTLVVADSGNKRVQLFGLINDTDAGPKISSPTSPIEKQENLLVDTEQERL